ncbi:MAG: chromosome segregation protein SMC, partial [Burkholderiales bacterium]
MEGWLAARELDSAPRLWQGMTIEPGWEDALEAVLRERLNGLALENIDRAAQWLTDQPPGKMTVVDVSSAGSAVPSYEMAGVESLQRYVTCRDSRIEPVLREWLYQVYVLPDAAAGLALRSQLPVGGVLVTREGHIYTRHSVSFHAPDSELHGVLTRQREIESLEADLVHEREAHSGAQGRVIES